MNKITVTTKEVLDELYNDSTLTIIGLVDDDENLQDFLNWVKEFTPIINENVYIIKGKIMNSFYHLSGSNRYKDDLTIVCVKLSDLKNSNAIVIPRFSVGGRWFDDVVDNNKRREKEKDV